MSREWGGTFTSGSHSRGPSSTRTIQADRPLFRDPQRPRRGLFPNGWQDAAWAAWTLAGFALAFLFGTAGWVLLEPLVVHR